MPKIQDDQIHRPTVALDGTSGRKVAPPSPMTLWFAIVRLGAAVSFGIISGASLAWITKFIYGSWEWQVFAFSVPFGTLAWLIFAKQPENPEGRFQNQMLDWLIKAMLADLPLPIENMTSPVLVGMLVLVAIPFFLWSHQRMGIVVPGGVCFTIRDIACMTERARIDSGIGILVMTFALPAVLAAILHRKVLREIIFHKPGYASKDDSGAPGPLITIVGFIGAVLELFGLRGRWFSRQDPRALDWAFGAYLIVASLLFAALVALMFWTFATLAIPSLRFWINL